MSNKKWRMPASKSRPVTKEKKDDSFELILRPMPEIELIDPITGRIPKNYKEILAARANGQSTTKEIIQDKKFELTLKPMPEIALLDPITGELPKNYKDILAGRACNTRRSKDFDFQKSKVQSNNSTLSLAGQTHYGNTKIGPRKALFTNSKETARVSAKSGLPQKSTKINPGINESVLLDIEETERKLFLQNKKPKISTIKFPKHNATSLLKTIKTQRKRSASSNSSLEEFLKMEQQTKTPKSATVAKRQKNIDLAASLQEITTKLNENRNMMNKIVTNDNEINKNLQQILGYLHQNNFKQDCLDLNNATKNAASTDEMDEDKENISQNPLPRQPSVEDNLRVATLKSNLKKKVLFDLETEDCDSLLKKKDFGSQTPNTMLRSATRRANQQLLALQDTPKSSM